MHGLHIAVVASSECRSEGAELTKLSKEQADYIGVGVDGLGKRLGMGF